MFPQSKIDNEVEGNAEHDDEETEQPGDNHAGEQSANTNRGV